MNPRMKIIVEFVIIIPTIAGLILGYIFYLFVGPPSPNTNFIVGFVGGFFVSMAIGTYGNLFYAIHKANKEHKND